MNWISFDAATCATMPWRNGGGTTCELLTLLARDGDRTDGNGGTAAAFDAAFDARISLATIAHPGPFSAFPGIDRQITLLDGSGVRLTAHNGAFDHRLETSLAPYAFDGDIALDATWVEDGADNAARVLNVMTRRGRCEASIAVVTTGSVDSEAAPPSNRTVEMRIVARGTWRVIDPRNDGATTRWTFGQGAYRDSTQRASLRHASTPQASPQQPSPQRASPQQRHPHTDERRGDTGALCPPANDLNLVPLTPDAALIAVRITFLAAP